MARCCAIVTTHFNSDMCSVGIVGRHAAEDTIDTFITLVQKYSSPALGFNCVGGDSATNLMKHLA